MTQRDKNRYKSEFKQDLDRFAATLKNYVSTKTGDWTVKGFIDVYQNIYTVSSDTKIISKILEIHLFPKLIEFAAHIKCVIVPSEKQNWYPDLTFISKHNPSLKFALDIKTTFRRDEKTAGFTLGSHGGYFKERDKTKNIQFPYNHYAGHYCLGIIYTRVNGIEDEVKPYRIETLKSITSVINDFDFFAAEKWKIASDKQGSGNTANIGSILNVDDLKNENGMFSRLGEKWFDEYWMNYGSATMVKEGRPVKITTLKDFLEFKERKDLWSKIVLKTSKLKS
jgi:hypothetical protein